MTARNIVTAALLLAACDPGNVVLLAPEASGSTPTFSIHAALDTPYAALADSLGWNGGIPGATVRVHLMTDPYDDSSYWHVATTDSGGLATFPGLLAGLYEIEVTRTLTADERAVAAVHMLAGGRRIYVPAPEAVDVLLQPAQRGSLVFSEFWLSRPADGYTDANYFEIYNNSDTTIYLDGKYWGIGWDLNRDYPYWPCAQTESVRNDPDGIWASAIFRFPGRGTEYPLAPGRTAVVAKVAIDHRAINPLLPDLSHADFEWGSTSSANNPDVPNLQSIGPELMNITWPWPDQPEFLSEPADLSTLPRYIDPYSGHVWVRIPRAAILDASVGVEDFTHTRYTPEPACLEDLHRSFERLAGPPWEPEPSLEQGLSAQRRVLMVLPDGRKALQDTNTSMADFVYAPRTPGWIPDSLPE